MLIFSQNLMRLMTYSIKRTTEFLFSVTTILVVLGFSGATLITLGVYGILGLDMAFVCAGLFSLFFMFLIGRVIRG